MSYFKRFFGHLKTVLTHKRWVFYYASHLGYTWRGFAHDMSKFSPVEFFESVKYWNGKRSPILSAKEIAGVSHAWLHHRGHNRHHYEYWVDRVNDKLVYHKIPFKYAIEMVCDWLAACRTYTGDNKEVFRREYEWWKEHTKKLKLNKDTKHLVGVLLWNLYEQESSGRTEKQALKDVASMLPGWKALYEDPDINYSKYHEESY